MIKDINNHFTQDDYEIIKREPLYDGFMHLVRYHLRTRKFNGGYSPIYKREILERSPAAAVLPYDPVLDQVILIEQFRVGALANPENPWILEVVAGLLESDDENPAAVAIREAKEEAGLEIKNLQQISETFSSPGGTNERLTLFCGHVDSSNAGGIFGLEVEEEDIRAIVLPVQDAFALVQQGKIKTAPALISLLWLQLNHEWLKQLWLTK